MEQTGERALLWEGEPVLVYAPPELVLPAGAPRRAARWCRRLEAAWRKRWEGPLYQRARAAAQEAWAASRPFQPWQASLAGTWTEGEGLLCLRWEAAETVNGRRCALWGSALWTLPGGAPATAEELLGRGWRRWARAQVSAQIQARLDSGQSLFYPHWRRRLGRQVREEHLFWTGEGWALFCPTCTLAPALEGTPVFSLAPPAKEPAGKR